MGALLSNCARAQELDDISTKTSELTRQNLSHVAASAAQIRSVLAGSPGLLVDLKRWAARDAASHGQIVRDADLTDDAIFQRLEADTQFRSVATSLLQQYGYLVPKLDPASDLGKERELLIQERVKWLAQNQEEELAQARQTSAQNSQNAAFCGPQLPGNCKSQRASSPPSGGQDRDLDRELSPQGPPTNAVPAEPWPPSVPGNSRIRPTQIAQADQDATDVFFPLTVGAPVMAGAADRNGDLSSAQGTAAQYAISDTNSAFSMPGFGQPEASINSLGAYPMGANGAAGMTSDAAEAMGRAVRSDATSAVPTNTSMTEPMRRYQPAPALRPVELVRKASPYSDIP